MRLAGRCECGVAFAVFTRREWDQHLRCWGLRWCGVCGEVAGYRLKCRFCKRRRDSAYRREWLLIPSYRAKRNAWNRAWQAQSRRGDSPTYQRQKAHKRQRYAERKAA